MTQSHFGRLLLSRTQVSQNFEWGTLIANCPPSSDFVMFQNFKHQIAQSIFNTLIRGGQPKLTTKKWAQRSRYRSGACTLTLASLWDFLSTIAGPYSSCTVIGRL